MHLIELSKALFTKESRPLVRNLLLVGVILLLVGIWLISQSRPAYMDRYFSVLLPFIAVLVGVGSRQVWSKLQLVLQRFSQDAPAKAFLLIQVLIGFFAGFQIHESHTYAKENWRTLAELLVDAGLSKQSVWLSDSEAMTARIITSAIYMNI